jgi:uncharacterized protein (DUF488 family)
MSKIMTVGHSTRSLSEFMSLLDAHGVRLIADVRRFPMSRRHPHFARPRLESSMREAAVEYMWLPGLGGRRERRADSPHTGWREAAFAGYADHMDTQEFLDSAAQLVELSARLPTAIMCAEALPERCHRRLIADWLTVRGLSVEHILDAQRRVPHELTPFARVADGRLLYDGGQGELALRHRS